MTPPEWLRRFIDRTVPLQQAEPSTLDRLDGVGANMATPQERRAEALEEMREHPGCIGCALGFIHDHPEDEEDES